MPRAKTRGQGGTTATRDGTTTATRGGITATGGSTRGPTLNEIMYNILNQFDFQLISVISNLWKSQKSIKCMGNAHLC